jgi:hypothetical protein
MVSPTHLMVSNIMDRSSWFTTAKYCWETEIEKVVYHADKKVGTIQELLGDDIALVKSKVKFSNAFLDIDSTAKSFLRPQDRSHLWLLSVGDMLTAIVARDTIKPFGPSPIDTVFSKSVRPPCPSCSPC